MAYRCLVFLWSVRLSSLLPASFLLFFFIVAEFHFFCLFYLFLRFCFHSFRFFLALFFVCFLINFLHFPYDIFPFLFPLVFPLTGSFYFISFVFFLICFLRPSFIFCFVCFLLTFSLVSFFVSFPLFCSRSPYCQFQSRFLLFLFVFICLFTLFSFNIISIPFLLTPTVRHSLCLHLSLVNIPSFNIFSSSPS